MLNVQYAAVGDVDTYASSHGHTYWASLSAAEKNRAVMTATLDVESYHKQPRRSNLPWSYGCEMLKEAATLQSLYVSRTIGQRDASDSLASLGKSGVSDGVISASDPVGQKLDSQAKSLVKLKLKDSGIAAGQYVRG